MEAAAAVPAPLTRAELEAGLGPLERAPRDGGRVEMLVVRPRPGERVVLDRAQLSPELGLDGDRWCSDGERQLAEQLTLMSSRVLGLLTPRRELWPLAGDQLLVDLDLSRNNVPPGTRLGIGSAVIEVSPLPHTGCRKFRDRFGLDAMRFVNSEVGKRLQLRGINAFVVEAGRIAVGDSITKR